MILRKDYYSLKILKYMEKNTHDDHQNEPNAEPIVLTDEEKRKREEEIKANEKNIETNSHK